MQALLRVMRDRLREFHMGILAKSATKAVQRSYVAQGDRGNPAFPLFRIREVHVRDVKRQPKI